MQPTKRKLPGTWENIYCLAGIDEDGYYTHTHIHENDLERYTGDIPDNYRLLSKACKNEINIRVGRLKEIFGAAFTENEIVKRILSENNMTEESADTGELLWLMLQNGALNLSNKLSCRSAGRLKKDNNAKTDL